MVYYGWDSSISSMLSVYLLMLVLVVCEVSGSHRQKRALTVDDKIRILCEKKYIPLLKDRLGVDSSLCKPKSVDFLSGDVSTQDIAEILNVHNSVRAKVTDATNMLKMYWDEDAALVAQAYANTCQTNHDSGWSRFTIGGSFAGQNIASGSGSWTDVINNWAAEISDYTYGIAPVNNAVVGHYTQIIWAWSYRIGCGKAVCKGNIIHVCNYSPPGNMGADDDKRTEAYTRGTLRSECKAGNTGPLCDCGQSVYCVDGGKLKSDTCTCDCKVPTVGTNVRNLSDCSLNCANVDSAGEPGTSQCSQFTECTGDASGYTIGYCPALCKLCEISAFQQNSNDLINQVHAASNQTTTTSAGGLTGGGGQSGQGGQGGGNGNVASTALASTATVAALLVLAFTTSKFEQ
ncbi:cysteine-rich venom protein-like [Tubulanus polymorphus]|uniref:cysteine-rich venom protein-like n=1 Tax=Tubulanus polymorphus TaxID=672921 RepID=UPI003DA62494